MKNYEYIKLIRLQDEKNKELKKENKLLKAEIEAYTGRCILCGSRENLTKHSLIGKHRFPFVVICEKHHRMIEGYKLIINVLNKNKKLSVTNFKKMNKVFTE